MKKIATLLVALLFALGVSIPAFAQTAADTKDGKGTAAVETKKDEGKPAAAHHKAAKKHVKKAKKAKGTKKGAPKTEEKAQ